MTGIDGTNHINANTGVWIETFAQIMLALAKAIEEVIAGIINAGMGV